MSNVPAWLVVKANAYARQHGKTPFVVYQAPYSVLHREIEREVLPMCVHEGLALCAFNVLASGHIRSDAEEEARRATGERGRTVLGMPWERTPAERAVCAVLERVGDLLAVHAVDQARELHDVARLVALQAADEVAGHVAEAGEGGVLVLGDLLGPVLADGEGPAALAQQRGGVEQVQDPERQGEVAAAATLLAVATFLARSQQVWWQPLDAGALLDVLEGLRQRAQTQ